ncbi:MAG: L,D-transpeptidase family protein [Candidatus Azobacteroides sp.]|nr:L,D-transpeptidase family protein [Candidatus Azobacteroides sp.]
MNAIHSISDVFYKSQFEKLYPDFDAKELHLSLQNSFSDTTLIDQFYKKNDYESVWVKDTFEVAKIDTLLFYLNNSTNHGLDPDLFEVRTIKKLRDSIMAGSFSDSMPALYSALIRLEKQATKSVQHYTSGMKYGFIDVKKVFPVDYFIPLQSPDSVFNEFVFTNIESQLTYLLSEVSPKDSIYSRMQKGLQYYRAFSDTTFDLIPFRDSKKNYKLDDSDPQVMPLIAKRLMITGELSYSENADSIYKILTPELMQAINVFRQNNSYPEDEEVGKITIDALNRPISYYTDKFVANLERYRWKRQTLLPEKYVEVNIAAFHLIAVEPGRKMLKMNVCAGIPFKNQTPLLESAISYINLNPKWNVPRSIIEKEIYFSIKKDPNYFKRNNMQVTRNGRVVDPDTIDWSKFNNPKTFPFLAVQDSGDGNSLGRIKFMFNNPFSVYLHDTPSKRAFSYTKRGVSHGCVRIQKPMDFAFFCMAKKDSLYFDRLRYSVDQPVLSKKGKELLRQGSLTKLPDIVNLAEKIPLFIDYFTIYSLPEEQKLYFADDAYGFDERINKELKKF